jgi:hypothetical protein
MARIIVATTGYDITADQKNLVLDSDVGNLMVIDEQDIAGSATEYTHGLGYLPTTFEYFEYGSQWFPINSPIYDTSGIIVGVNSPRIEYDINKIYFTQFNALNIKLFISGNAADDQTGSGKNTASGKLKIAKAGLNVPDITDVRQFQFCSGLDTIKKDLALSGTTTISSSGTFTKSEITHSLGYVPVVIAKIESNDYDTLHNGSMLPLGLSIFDVTPVSFYVTSTKIVFFVDNVIADFTIKYNLYRNKIA